MKFQGIQLTWLGHSTFRIETPEGIALLPIGDLFTMSSRKAAYACKPLQPETVTPMHFGTFPPLTGTPGELRKLAPDVEVLELKPGKTIS